MGAKERGGGAVRAVARGAVGADNGLPERGLSVLRRFALPLPRLPLLHDQVQDRARAHALSVSFFLLAFVGATKISLLVFLPRGGNAAVLAQALDLGLNWEVKKF
uniref:Uncharacterized protein n=1 Tax=Zea mays TaxID=4577 RepID=A0A804UG77_MAIZE